MKKILQDLLQGKFAISYTLETIAKMVPRQIKWLNNLPVLGYVFLTGQFFWFITKIIFFTMVISWFKPQYSNVGAKLFLFAVTFGLIFFAGWIIRREFKQEINLSE